MHLLSTALTALALSAASVQAAVNGFSVSANNPDGSCKSPSDWGYEMSTIKSWGFDTLRLYASSDCNTLANAVPAAQAAGVKLMAGVWATDATHFDTEKQALLGALQQYGSHWLVGVSVGSEDLYRGDVSASQLAQQIYDVRGMVQGPGGASSTPVGHTDTWTAWVDGSNAQVVTASDFLLVDGYPYWQGSDISSARDTFFQSYDATVNAAQGKPVMIGETGWPTGGDNYESAVAGVSELQSYWKSVGCELKSRGIDYYWFSDVDCSYCAAGVEQNFGVAYNLGSLEIDLSC
ncbi:hypothetical protein YB2330_006199 [Saitoella coloradoensis]